MTEVGARQVCGYDTANLIHIVGLGRHVAIDTEDRDRLGARRQV